MQISVDGTEEEETEGMSLGLELGTEETDGLSLGLELGTEETDGLSDGEADGDLESDGLACVNAFYDKKKRRRMIRIQERNAKFISHTRT